MALREKIAAQQKHLKELDEHLYTVLVLIHQAALADHEIASSFRAKRAGRGTDLPPTQRAVSKLYPLLCWEKEEPQCRRNAVLASVYLTEKSTALVYTIPTE